ncbi:hypothetical protein DPPLL_08960 [Desulfofustis limnaeus]|jgi:O-acetyl-ADP-ribose deacetylase (regulator of RNase III)|uniref:Macro domain-containing protein n=1 Tax=Desulfofustis limnaeus TaxID=2740163 RepID=A0ABM7W6G0_9BACT|nr:O-acetyl-ADP-ribose deacetylase [Desulfofustis limnaeus]MDX9895278.1 O-acetyl-ADP-ribose deacetylase [Desulfofustis sp.]BDD86531.1 hypothetical protein DPPLL_08960 [Desulfofustis limnaeus]
MRIQLIKGDITTFACDAIVNAANSSLMGGGGVDGAIHRAAGPQLVEECKVITQRQGPCHPGQAVLTKGYNLVAAHVIHTVGPIWRGGTANEEATLRSCYENIVRLAHQHRLKTLAIPNISTGVYGFPKELAAQTVAAYFRGVREHERIIEIVTFVCFDDENLRLYRRSFSDLLEHNNHQEQLQKTLDRLQTELADREAALPAHSVRPHQIMVIEALEEEIAQVKQALDRLEAGDEPGPDKRE